MGDVKRILLVEDDPDIRRVTRATLTGAGYEVAEAENGKRGIEQVRLARPDLVILDVMMPEMNGAEFCRALVEELNIPDQPVLIVSSINEKSGLMRLLSDVNLTNREFVKKPVGPVELKLRVAQMLGLEPRPSRPAARTEAPVAPAPAGPTIVPAPPSSSLEPPSGSETEARLRVLIVDDDRDLLQINKFTLAKDYDVATAENGLDGLEMLDLFEPDFVLVDYNMPSMDGLQMVELMRRHPRFHQTPALFLTGNEQKHLPRRAHEIGGNLFLRKPMEPARLRRAIAHFIREAGLKPAGQPSSPPATPSPAQPAPAAPAKLAPPPVAGPASMGTKARMRPRSQEPARPAPPAPRPASNPPAPAAQELVRLLIVDDNPETSGRILQIVEAAMSGRVHHHHVSEHLDALANLARWEPDIILYNPRNKGMDGIAFFQMFKIKRLDLDVEFVFSGTEFVNAEHKYSRQSFGRDVLDLSESESHIVYELQSAIEKAERKPRSKRHTIEELREEDAREKAQRSKAADREARQREFDRKRYSRIQSMLDKET